MAQAGADVHLIARGAHLRALRGHGLRVRSVKSDFAVRILATDDPTDVGPCEYVLFCVKAFDSEAAAAKLRSLLSGGSAVVSLQNGVDNEEKLASVIGTEQVLGGVAFSFACIAEPDVIMQTGGPSSIIFGEPDGRLTGRAQRLLDICERGWLRGGVVVEHQDRDVGQAGLHLRAGRHDRGGAIAIGEIRPVDAGWKTFQRLVGEVAAVAEADGRPLPPAVVQLALA